MWILHLDTLTWAAVGGGSGKSAAPTPSQNGNGPAAADDVHSSRTLPPCAGHALVPWGSSLLVVGGHLKVRAVLAIVRGSTVGIGRLLQASPTVATGTQT